MITIGLTGGIGSGKTTVSEYLENKGYNIIDADKVAKDILQPGRPTTKKIIKEFGSDIVDKYGKLKRKHLASIVFKNKEKENLINEITHSEIKKKIFENLAKIKATELDGIVFIDAPLLFETGMDRLCDEVWLIISNVEERIERVIQRDAIREEDVLRRMNSQMGDKEKMKLATIIIENFGTKEELYHMLDRLLIDYE